MVSKVQRPRLRPGTVEQGFLWEPCTGPRCSDCIISLFCHGCFSFNGLNPHASCKLNTKIAVNTNIFVQLPIAWDGNKILFFYQQKWKQLKGFLKLKRRGDLSRWRVLCRNEWIWWYMFIYMSVCVYGHDKVAR